MFWFRIPSWPMTHGGLWLPELKTLWAPLVVLPAGV